MIGIWEAEVFLRIKCKQAVDSVVQSGLRRKLNEEAVRERLGETRDSREKEGACFVPSRAVHRQARVLMTNHIVIEKTLLLSFRFPDISFRCSIYSAIIIMECIFSWLVSLGLSFAVVFKVSSHTYLRFSSTLEQTTSIASSLILSPKAKDNF